MNLGEMKMKVEMQSYKSVLVALDVYSAYEPVLNRALNIVSDPSQVSLIYVTLPYVFFEPYAVDAGRDFVGDIQKKALSKLQEIARLHEIPDQQVFSLIGNAADEIHDKAEETNADLIVIGTHGQSGLKLLLGSTANAVLHGAKCDVLSVKI